MLPMFIPSGGHCIVHLFVSIQIYVSAIVFAHYFLLQIKAKAKLEAAEEEERSES